MSPNSNGTCRQKNSHESNLQIDSMCSIVIRGHLKFIETQSKAPSLDNYEKDARRGRPNGISNWF